MLPIEALEVFSNCSALARDFSLHVNSNRQAKQEGAEEMPKIALAGLSYIVDLRGEDTAKTATGRGQVGIRPSRPPSLRLLRRLHWYRL